MHNLIENTSNIHRKSKIRQYDLLQYDNTSYQKTSKIYRKVKNEVGHMTSIIT